MTFEIFSSNTNEGYDSKNDLNTNTMIESEKNHCEGLGLNEANIRVELEKKRNIGVRTCSNCGTSSTSTWRNLGDRIVCNACKCFFRKHGKNRPIHMRKDSIITRHRKSFKLSIPNEVVFNVHDVPIQNSLEFDSGAVAEVMCLMLQYLKNT